MANDKTSGVTWSEDGDGISLHEATVGSAMAAAGFKSRSIVSLKRSLNIYGFHGRNNLYQNASFNQALSQPPKLQKKKKQKPRARASARDVLSDGEDSAEDAGGGGSAEEDAEDAGMDEEDASCLPESIDELPTLTRMAKSRIPQDSDDRAMQPIAVSKCGICLSAIADDCATLVSMESSGPAQCQHCYHVDCIAQWAQVENTCPLCKMSFAQIARRDMKTGFVLSHQLVTPQKQQDGNDTEQPSDDEVELDTSCMVCGEEHLQDNGDANLLICDGGCGRICHCFCAGFVAVPSGDWLCDYCAMQPPKLGQCVEAQFDDDVWYHGVIDQVSGSRGFCVHFEDGDKQWEMGWGPAFRLLPTRQ